MTMSSASLALLALLVALGHLVDSAKVTPMEKVLQMMAEMRAKGEEEKNAEAVTFATFATWCTNTANSRGKSIKKGESAMERLSAEILKLDSDARELGEEIQALDKTIDSTTIEKNKANSMRKTDHDEYEVDDKDLGNSIDDAKAAKKELKRMMASVPSFVQISSDDEQEPSAHTFDSQSGQITEVVTGLEHEFSDEKEDGWKEEAEAEHAWTMLEQTLTDEIEESNRIRDKKASTKKNKEAASAEAKGELAETTKTHDDDVAYLTDLKATCEQKTKDFEARQKLRQGELEAIDEATEILKSVAGSAEKHLPGLVQVTNDASALAQLRSGEASRQLAQSDAASYLERMAQKYHSRTLSLISVRVAADPFKKVTKMIKDMIYKLQEEATDEAEHKGFCDTELGTNKQSRDSLSNEVSELTASIEKQNAKITTLSNEISALTADVAELDGAVAKATELRAAEKAKNTETIADAKEAVTAVSQAITVLKEFYAKAAGSTAFMQQATKGVSDDMPETFDKPYTGMEGGGVMGMLEVCLSDFQRLEADTTQAEASAEDEFTKFNNDSQLDKAEKSTSIKMKDQLKTKTESEAQTNKGDLKSAQGQLDAALEYFEKLKPSCVNTEISYEDRVAARKEEIQSLKEALQILQ